MLLDPRPYTYEFRKPRYSNPTLYLSFHSVNQGTSTKVSTIDTPINPMITLPKVKEITMLRCKNFPKLSHTLDKINRLKDMDAIWKRKSLIMNIIKVGSLLLFSQIRRSKWKVISCPQSIEAIRKYLEWILMQEVNTCKPQTLTIFCKEKADLKDSVCLKDSKSPTISSVAIQKKRTATSWELSRNWPSRTN